MPVFTSNYLSNQFSELFGPYNLFYLRNGIYLTDFLDILIITMLLYFVFLLFKKARTVVVFTGILLLASIYILAKVFNLYLTLITLRYFFGVSLIIFAIIFQQEIRKYFELLGLFGSRFQVGRLIPKSPTIAEIILACIQMAQSKTGALIVIQGKDSLSGLIEGGIALEGQISEEIIASIFYPNRFYCGHCRGFGHFAKRARLFPSCCKKSA